MTEDRWPTRLAAIAELIPPGTSVIDLGAGSRALEDRLPDGCLYEGVDLPDFDMNRGRWPDGLYGVAIMAGVLEYARYPGAAFRHLRDLAPVAIVTYSHRPDRRDPSWENALTEENFVKLAERAGFGTIEPVAMWRARGIMPQTIWRLS